MAVEVTPAGLNSISSSRLSARFRKRNAGDFTVDVEFNVGAGITILFGPSGAGKTTLLDCIAGLQTPDAGKVVIGERVFFDRDRKLSLPVRRRKIGYVFQDLVLFPHLSAEENIAYGLRGSGSQQIGRAHV